ncbi:MAG: hydroxylamine oxidase [Nitrospirae bacterium GWC2_42_7]|nr:MAG: hydroxylamine oxidase [Nitrospirae bacterium GWC2_42_7]
MNFNKTFLQNILFLIVFLSISISLTSASSDEKTDSGSLNISSQTQECIECHKLYTPGIVSDWLSSRHAKTRPVDAFKKPVIERRISVEKLSDELKDNVVGCYECHSRNPEKHMDNFEHNGYKINVIVSPNDCKTCHPVEVEQYSGSKKFHAIKILEKNPVYHTLVESVTGVKKIKDGKIVSEKASESTLHDTCMGCHGTKVEVKGMKNISSGMGDMSVPDLTNWPNQGVGRENPDGSFGSCASCHPRHGFSIEVARKPYTCAQCHLEPDTPAWNVYKESKHGNIYFSKYHEWNFNAVPWTIGKDFKSPTCATCHNSLLVSPEGDIISERNHNFGSKLWVRIFGLIYSHPQPISGDTTIINNQDGLPLPVTFSGEPASEFLINKAEQAKRLEAMKNICKGCHSTQWADGHFTKLDNTVKETDAMTMAATNLMSEAWGKGIEDKANPFDEQIEKMWIRQWLFYSNSIRYASAMSGAPDYTSFKLGWWELSENLQKMRDAIDIKEKNKKAEKEIK